MKLESLPTCGINNRIAFGGLSILICSLPPTQTHHQNLRLGRQIPVVRPAYLVH